MNKILKILRVSTLIIIFLFTSVSAFTQLTPSPEISSAAETYFQDGKTQAVIRVFYRFPENFHQTLNKDFFKAEIITPDNLNTELEYPEGITEKGEVNYYQTAELTLFTDISTLDEGMHTFTVKASYQLCDEEGICYFPGSEDVDINLEITADNGSQLFGNKSEVLSAGIIKYLFLAFIGGLLLNIMPCVFPLLSIKALSLVKQSEHNRKEILFSSFFYSAGIIISLLILAVILIIIKNAGQFAGWGFQMQNKWFVLFLISMIYLFSLSMFDVFTISLPGVNTAGKLSGKSGYTGHFLTGIFAVLVAAPCTAPFLGSAIAFSLSGSSLLILFSFLFIGAGFAFPFILLGLNPALIKKLPKPGKWSVYFKEILGFILAGTSFYLLISFGEGKPSTVVSSILIFLFIITFFAWIYGKIILSGIKRIYSVLILILLIVLSVFSAATVPQFNYSGDYSDEGQSEFYEVFSEEKLLNVLNDGKSVFVDIYADWCTTCKINDRLVLNTDEIKDLFKEKNIILLKGDFTDGNNEIAQWMKKNSKAGVPVYAYYKDNKSKAVFLPEILTKKMIRNLAVSN